MERDENRKSNELLLLLLLLPTAAAAPQAFLCRIYIKKCSLAISS
jgi:hypothetical protein